MTKPETKTEEFIPRTFELNIRSTRKGEKPEKRKVVLEVNLGAMAELKNDPEAPLDLLSDPKAIETIATDKFLQGRLIYAFSDAQDVDPVEFMRGLTATSIAEALRALRGALVDFFLAGSNPDLAQNVVTTFEGMLKFRQNMAEKIKGSKVNEAIVELLTEEDVQTVLDQAIAEGRKEIDELLGRGRGN